LRADVLQSLGLPAEKLNVYNAHVTRESIARKHNCDVEFIERRAICCTPSGTSAAIGRGTIA
jgi:hypothetical protein